MQKKLYRSESDKKISGVCGGLAEYIGIDSTVIRLIWVILFFAYGAGLLAYIVAALIMPAESDVVKVIKKPSKKNKGE